MKNIVNDILLDEKIWEDLDSLEHMIDEIDLHDKSLENLDANKKVEIEEIMFTKNLINELEGTKKTNSLQDKTFFTEEFKINKKLKAQLETNFDMNDFQENKSLKKESTLKTKNWNNELKNILQPLEKKIEIEKKEQKIPEYDLKEVFEKVKMKNKKLTPLKKRVLLEDKVKEYEVIFQDMYVNNSNNLQEQTSNYWLSVIDELEEEWKLKRLIDSTKEEKEIISDEKVLELIDENTKLKYLIKLLETKLKQYI